MNFLDFALLYLLCFRLSVVAAGIVCVILGYKLFASGLSPGGREANSTIEASVVGTKFSIKNAAPGTAFAIFGALILVVMMIQNAPSVTYDTLSRLQAGSSGGQGQQEEQSEKVILKGSEQNPVSMLTAQGQESERQGDLASAERSYQQAIDTVAAPLNDLALLYLKTGRAKEAKGLAELAVQLNPEEARYKTTEEQVKKALK